LVGPAQYVGAVKKRARSDAQKYDQKHKPFPFALSRGLGYPEVIIRRILIVGIVHFFEKIT
jgi:hypothetical protein